MKISFFKKIYLWFIRFMDKLTKEEGDSDDESDILIAKPERYLINVTLGEFTFTLRVTEKNETEYRQIVKQLNEELEKNKKRYPNMTSAHLFALIALKEALKKETETHKTK